MKRSLSVLTLLAIAPLASGCVAAIVPLAAGGIMTREQLRNPGDKQDTARNDEPATPEAQAVATPAPAPQKAGTEPQPVAPDVAKTPTVATPGEADAGVDRAIRQPGPDGRAGEDAAYSLQAYQSLWNHVARQAARRREGQALQSVVLIRGAPLDAPRYMPCGNKPLAIIFDLDENPAKSVDPDAYWRRWIGDGSDALAAVPGAVEGVEAARREGVTVIFSSAQQSEDAAGVVAVLDRLGFGKATPGQTLYLRGDLNDPASDDGVRQTIAERYCVIALVGDQLGEFSDQFDTADNAGRRPVAATETMVAPMWGAGWFLLPSPVRSVSPTDSQGVK